MNKIKFTTSIIFISLLFSACSSNHKINLDTTKKDNYASLVDSIYNNMKKCYQTFPINHVFGIYPLKEKYLKPEYSKVTLYGKFADNQIDDRLGVITIFKSANGNHRVVITGRNNLLYDWYYKDKMECK